LPRTIVLPAALARNNRLGFRIALENKTEKVVAVAVRDLDIDRGLARDEAALRLVAQHRDELGAIVGLRAQRLVRDDDRGSRHGGRRDAMRIIQERGLTPLRLDGWAKAQAGITTVEEVLRVLDALQTDELCPCNRAVGGDTLARNGGGVSVVQEPGSYT